MRLTLSRSLLSFQLARAGAVLLGSVLIARLAGNPTAVGYFEELLLLGGAITFFWVSGIINPFLPYFQTLSADKKAALPPQVFLILTGLSIMAHGAAWVFLGSGSNSNPFLHLFLLYSLFSAPAFLYEYLLFLEGRATRLFLYGLLNAAAYLLCLGLPAFYDSSLKWCIHALIGYGILRYLLTLGHLAVRYRWQTTWQLKPFIRNASPYLVSLLLTGAFSYVDGLIVDAYFSKDAFAIYRYGARELPIALLMASAFSNSKSAELALSIRQGKLNDGLLGIKDGSVRMMHILFPLSIALMFLAKPLFGWVYGQTFESSAEIFSIFLLLVISRVCFPQTVLLGLQRNQKLLFITGAELAVNIILNLIFIRHFGLKGIAFATVGAYFGEKLLLTFALRQEGISLQSYFPLRIWLVYSMLTIVAFSIMYFL